MTKHEKSFKQKVAFWSGAAQPSILNSSKHFAQAVVDIERAIIYSA